MNIYLDENIYSSTQWKNSDKGTWGKKTKNSILTLTRDVNLPDKYTPYLLVLGKWKADASSKGEERW